jgi:hypothetical protein
MQDLIARAPHGNDPVYIEDNQFLYALLRTFLQDGFAFTYVKDQARTRDGRAAYIQVKTMIFGQGFKAKIRAQSDRLLATTKYTGYKNFTLEHYGIKLREAFKDLEDNGEQIQEDRKVEAYLKGIKDPKLAVMKATILADDDKANSLDAAMRYATMFVCRTTNEDSRNISAYEGGGRGGRGGRGGKGGRGGGRGRGRGGRGRGKGKMEYIPAKKWFAMTAAEKQAVIDAREKNKDAKEDEKKRKVAAVDVDNDDEETPPKKKKGAGESMIRK